MGYRALFNNSNAANNTAVGSYALNSMIGGGGNTAMGFNALTASTTGANNTAIGLFSQSNNTSGSNNVSLGYTALITNISGGNNTAVGNGADVNAGNIDNASAIGAGAKVNNSNSMAFGSTSVTAWAFGRTSINASMALQVGSAATNGNGASLTSGGVWTNASDSAKKENFTTIDGASLLTKIKQLPITRWKYKGTDEYHIGPMAQDFYSLFNVGVNNTSISTLDPAGIALKAIQYQQTLLEAEQTKNATQQKQIDALQKDVVALKQLLKESITKTK